MVWTEAPLEDKPVTSSLTSKEQTILYLAARGCHPFGSKRIEQSYAVLQNLSLLLDKLEAELIHLNNNEKGRKEYKSGTNDNGDKSVVDEVYVETDVSKIVAPDSRLHKLCVDDVIAFFAENFDVNHLCKLVDKESGGVEAMMDDAPFRMVYTVPPPGLEIPEEYKRELEVKGIIGSGAKDEAMTGLKGSATIGAFQSQMQREGMEHAQEGSPKYAHDSALPVSEQEESAAESGPLDEDDRLAMRHDFYSFRTHHRAIAVARSSEQQPVATASGKVVEDGEESTRVLRGMVKKPGTSSDASSKSVSAPSTPNKRQSIGTRQNSSSMVTPRKRGRPSTRR